MMGVKLFNGTTYMQKKCPQKLIHFGCMKVHGFHGNPLCDLKVWGVHTKILISQQQLIVEY